MLKRFSNTIPAAREMLEAINSNDPDAPVVVTRQRTSSTQLVSSQPATPLVSTPQVPVTQDSTPQTPTPQVSAPQVVTAQAQAQQQVASSRAAPQKPAPVEVENENPLFSQSLEKFQGTFVESAHESPENETRPSVEQPQSVAAAESSLSQRVAETQTPLAPTEADFHKPKSFFLSGLFFVLSFPPSFFLFAHLS